MNKRWKKIVLYAAALIIAILAIFVYWITWTGSTDHIESVADQFKVPDSWELVRDHADPPRTLCIAQRCPNLVRTWSTPAPITQTEISDILNDSGWGHIVPHKDCEQSKTASGSNVCRMYGVVDRYKITISALTESPSLNKPTVSLLME